MRTFTFGTYNLREGGLDDGSDARLGRQLDMLAAHGADAWAIQECNHWAADRHREYLNLAEKRLGMRGFLAASNHGCDVALFIRESPDITIGPARHETRPPWWHAVARVDILIGGLPCRLISAHLAPSSPAQRLIEAEALALITGKGPEAPAVIAGGDWNAVPAGDPDPDTSRADPATARRKLDRSAARAIEETGLRDVAACLGDQTPTVGHHSSLAYRCDRIYARLPETAFTRYQVLAEAEPASDHRPAAATFGLAAPAPAPAG